MMKKKPKKVVSAKNRKENKTKPIPKPDQKRPRGTRAEGNFRRNSKSARREMKLPKLSNSHQVFVMEYLNNGFQQTKAAIAAGYSPASAHYQACMMMQRPDIRKEIETRMRGYVSEMDVTAKTLIRALAIRALSNMNHYALVTEKGRVRLLPSFKLADGSPKPFDYGQAIAELSEGKQGVKLKLHNPDAACDKLMKHLGLCKEQSPLETLMSLFPEPLRGQILEALKQGGTPPNA